MLISGITPWVVFHFLANSAGIPSMGVNPDWYVGRIGDLVARLRPFFFVCRWLSLEARLEPKKEARKGCCGKGYVRMWRC